VASSLIDLMVKHLLQVQNLVDPLSGDKPKTEKLTPVAPLVNIYHFRARAGQLNLVSVLCD